MAETPTPPYLTTVRVDGQGRVVLPAAVRDRFHWSPGSTLHLRVTSTGVSILDRSAIVAEIRELARPAKDAGYSVEQFLAEKSEESRAEAASDRA